MLCIIWVQHQWHHTSWSKDLSDRLFRYDICCDWEDLLLKPIDYTLFGALTSETNFGFVDEEKYCWVAGYSVGAGGLALLGCVDFGQFDWINIRCTGRVFFFEEFGCLVVVGFQVLAMAAPGSIELDQDVGEFVDYWGEVAVVQYQNSGFFGLIAEAYCQQETD